MPYILKFSDPSKTEDITVPDYPPGINSVDTSLALVGRGYPMYGQRFAENFLHLLENFASPISPENPIEGQLWYDTSDPYNKVLRIMDGTVTSTRWPAANGIYQQTTDPKLFTSAGLKTGDIWVDTSSNQLKIYNAGAWTTVGPENGSGTGIESSNTILDTSDVERDALKVVVAGQVVAIFTNDSFTPKTVIDGFPGTLRTGLNLSKGISANQTFLINGTATSAQRLQVNGQDLLATRFLLKDDSSFIGQKIVGKVVFEQPVTSAAARNTYGLLINSASDSVSNANYIQLFKEGTSSPNATLFYSRPGGKIILRTASTTGSEREVQIENGCMIINVGTAVESGTTSLIVNGNSLFTDSISVLSTAPTAITVSGGIEVAADVSVGNSLLVEGTAVVSDVLTVGDSATVASGPILSPGVTDVYDIGSSSNKFRAVHASQLYATTFNGVAIGASVLSPPGMISLFAGAVLPNGWVQCNGATVSTSAYPLLYTAIGTLFGDTGNSTTFILPNIPSVVSNVNYIIKT